jgi:glycosyltransferase involved in cell wall biosynthesis
MMTAKSKEELAQERLDARAAKDFAKADQLRDQIAALGFEVIDVAGGFEFRAKERFPTFASTRDIKSIKVSGDIAIAMIVDGFTEDAAETVRTIKAHTKTPVIALVTCDPGELTEEIDLQFQLIAINENFGWGENSNAILKNISSKYLVIMDPSTRFTGDAMAPVLAELNKGEFNAVGWRGGLVNTEDEWRSVDDKGAGEVDVLFSYFMAFNCLDATNAGGFNNRAIYYRNADMEFSLRLRHSNGRLLQIDLPLEQARHHGYYDTDEEFREVQSKKNYDRILERFRGKSAILSPRR